MDPTWAQELAALQEIQEEDKRGFWSQLGRVARWVMLLLPYMEIWAMCIYIYIYILIYIT